MKETGIIMSGNYPKLSGYVIAPCENCGKERRVQLLGGQPRKKLCRSCARLGSHHSRETIAKISGENSSSWKGGRQNNGDGYILVKLQANDFFRAMGDSRGYVLEHRLIMAQHLGRCLLSWEIVHHKNGVRDDNRIDNLSLTWRGGHSSEHSKGYRDGYSQGYKDAQRKVESERTSSNL